MNKRALIEKICNSQTPEEAWKIIVNEWNYTYSLQDASEEWWNYRKFLNNLFKIFKEALKEGD
jgi:hypothetical protein